MGGLSADNLIVRREVWLACESELHPEIPSGDDMFLLEAVKRKSYQIAVIDEPEYTAVVRPAPTWRAPLRCGSSGSEYIAVALSVGYLNQVPD